MVVAGFVVLLTGVIVYWLVELLSCIRLLVWVCCRLLFSLILEVLVNCRDCVACAFWIYGLVGCSGVLWFCYLTLIILFG